MKNTFENEKCILFLFQRSFLKSVSTIPQKNTKIIGIGNMAEEENQQANDTGDAIYFEGSKGSAKNLVAKMPTQQYSTEYNMKHKHRGLALIFNHRTYAAEMDLKPRKGASKDSERLSTSLKKLHFDVKEYKDKKVGEILRIVEKASKIDHTENDCILIAILTHGKMGYLCAQDAEYKLGCIANHFTAENCKTLAGKPKLFFIQACQGEKTDSGIELRRTHTEGQPIWSYRIPIHADFLLAYSTIPGFFSWRNEAYGSWFIQSLCDELDENGKKYDILTLLTFVAQQVAVSFESKNNLAELNMKKQIPCTTTMLTRLLFFKDKVEN